MSSKLDAPLLLMPKATAVWLVENTAQTFEQIGDFTGLHAIEVQALADEEVGRGIVGRNPVEHGEVSQDELDKGNADPAYRMTHAKRRNDIPTAKQRSKGPKYTPVSKRGDKPDAVAYLLKHNTELSDAQICKLIGTTKPTIQAIRDRAHANMQNIKPRHPVDLGLCTYTELDAASRKALKAQGIDPDQVKAEKEAAEAAERERLQAIQQEESNPASGFDFSNFMSSSIGGESTGTDD